MAGILHPHSSASHSLSWFLSFLYYSVFLTSASFCTQFKYSYFSLLKLSINVENGKVYTVFLNLYLRPQHILCYNQSMFIFNFLFIADVCNFFCCIFLFIPNKSISDFIAPAFDNSFFCVSKCICTTNGTYR